jgi:hypothetical protein
VTDGFVEIHTRCASRAGLARRLAAQEVESSLSKFTTKLEELGYLPGPPDA